MFKIDGHFCYGRGYVYLEGGTIFDIFFGFVQGVRLSGIGTQIFLQNLAGGTFIRVGTLIRHCIVGKYLQTFTCRAFPCGTFTCKINMRHLLGVAYLLGSY